MSYILDALRRADSERERGAVPGIHAQPVPVPSADTDAQPPPRPWVWMAVGMSVVLAGVVAWSFVGKESPSRDASEPVAASPAPASPPPVFASPAPPPAQTIALPAAPPARAEPVATPASTADIRVYALTELPDDIRRQLPALGIGGSIYSEKPANRLLIINGQLFHEGDKPLPELSVEQIKLKSAVLRFKGYRYEVRF